jgi:hypothetical protein
MARWVSKSVPMPVPGTGLYVHASGRAANNMVAEVALKLGGVDGMHAWAKENLGDFYTKLFPKLMLKELNVSTQESIEDKLALLDEQDRASGRLIDAEPVPAEHSFART